MNSFKTIVEIVTPGIAFTLLLAVGLNLTPSDFARVRRAPWVVAVGLLAPLAALPAIAVMLIWWFEPDPFELFMPLDDLSLVANLEVVTQAADGKILRVWAREDQ